MAELNIGAYEGDDSSEVDGLYDTLVELDARTNTYFFGAIDTLFLQGEYVASTGVLVYPSGVLQVYDYNVDGTVNKLTCTHGGKSWTMQYTYDAVTGNVTQMDADDGASGSWQRLLTYNGDNTLNSGGTWA